jgi:hypothetical protein
MGELVYPLRMRLMRSTRMQFVSGKESILEFLGRGVSSKRLGRDRNKLKLGRP